MSPTRRSRCLAAGLAAALLVLLAAGPAEARRVRVFAAGPRFSLDWVDTPQHYHDKLLALFDGAQRTPDHPSVQTAVPDIASHLLGPADSKNPVASARDLVLLPEDLGLMAVFTGQRGQEARGASDLTTAILDLIGAYAPVSTYYAAQFPSLAQRPFPPTRLLAVSLTDQLGRTAVETFASLAARYHVYLEAGIDMARDWRIVCDDKATFKPPPGATGCDVQDPAKVALLRAPDEPDRDYAYEATTPDAVNMALVFDPSGKLISKQVKAYLTPTELPGQLDLKPGPSSGLGVVSTPVGRLAFVTSKDAWMPDVVSKLDAARAEILVQPEFFVNDTVSGTGAWSPDNLAGGGYGDLLRYPSFGAVALPSLVGNVFDFAADAQDFVAVKPRGGHTPSGGLVGETALPGFAAVSPWTVKDPFSAGETLAARRARLAAAGAAELPGGPSCADPKVAAPCAGGEAEGVVWRDVDVGVTARLHRSRSRTHAPRPFSASRPLALDGKPQRNVRLAAAGRRVWGVFEERRGGHDLVRLVRSAGAGAHWSSPHTLSDPAADAWWPSVAANRRGDVWVAWQQRGRGSGAAWQALLAHSGDGGRHFGAATRIDATSRADQWRPALAATGSGAYVAWIDERGTFATEDGLPQAELRGARVDGGSVKASERLDSTAAPNPFAATLDNAWAPSVAGDPAGHVLVSWIDFQDYDWSVFSRASADAGAHFADQLKLNDTPDGVEALEDTPSAALPAGRGLVAFTDWRHATEGNATPSRFYDTDVASAASPARDRQVDGHGGAGVSTFFPSLAALGGGGALVAWQDMTHGDGDIDLARLSGAGAPGRAQRVDDSGRAGSEQWRPQVVVSGRTALVAWEDDRDGVAQIFAARASTGSL